MKKSLLFGAIIALFAACNGNDPKLTQAVTFTVGTFEQSTAPMGMPAKAPIYDEAVDGTALTDIYVFDGGIEVLHQTSDMEDFGTFTLNLTHGNHNLSFIATRSIGISIDGSTMTMETVRSTFGSLLALNVGTGTTAQNITLNRITGKMVITITDAFPSNANEIEFVINPRYKDLSTSTLCAINGESVTQRVSCASKVGKENQSFTFTLLAPSLTEEYTADVTINVYDSSSTLIHAVSIADVRLAANTQTLLSGKLFRGTDAALSVDHSWKSDIVGTF
jgi:hypothetical protein